MGPEDHLKRNHLFESIFINFCSEKNHHWKFPDASSFLSSKRIYINLKWFSNVQIQRKNGHVSNMAHGKQYHKNTQFACKGTSTKSQKQFPKTRFTYLCIQNYITNMNQDYIISSVINFQAFDVLWLAKYGALSKISIKF